MLIEGAIRLIERTRAHWRAEQDGQACECLVRAQQIVTELVSALDHEVAPELTRQVAALYIFVFRALVDASLDREEGKLDEALRVLEPQREAWRDVCRELGNTTPLDNESAVASLSAQEPAAPLPGTPAVPLEVHSPGEASAGFSAEA